MKKNRRFTAFSLSFLDIMACGFGAVTLLFLILRHSVVEEVQPEGKRPMSAADFIHGYRPRSGERLA